MSLDYQFVPEHGIAETENRGYIPCIMKIAHLISQFYPYIGGAEICIHNICRKLVDEGHEAAVVTTIPEVAGAPPLPYRIFRISHKTNGLFRRWPWLATRYLRWMLNRYQTEHRFDLWQVTMGYPLGAYAADWFRRRRIPCILRCCGEDIQKMPEIGYGYRLDPEADRIVSKTYPLYDGLVALTESVRDDYLALGIPEQRVRIIPNGVDTTRFASTLRTPLFQERFGVSVKTRVLLTVGRHHPKKGYDRIPEIAANLKKRGIDFLWIIVGRDHEAFDRRFPDAPELGIRTLTDLPEPGGDAFSLPSKTLVAMYRAADVFVFPTLLETFGMVLVEAMAAGLPIVTTDAPGVRHVVRHGENGLCTRVGDIDGMTEQIATVLTDESIARDYAERSLRSAARYDWNRIVAEYLDFYRSILS
jgi:glycosyltransferase involved in cell wall biosynthesis